MYVLYVSLFFNIPLRQLFKVTLTWAKSTKLRKILIIPYLYYMMILSPKELNLGFLLLYDKLLNTQLKFQGSVINLLPNHRNFDYSKKFVIL